ncbi:MAG: ATP-dependent zinc metalloprotease FtsH [Myxococcota bacterium]
MENPREGWRSSAPLFIIVILMVLLMASLNTQGPVQRVPYSEFKALVKENAFTEVQVGPELVRGLLPREARGSGSSAARLPHNLSSTSGNNAASAPAQAEGNGAASAPAQAEGNGAASGGDRAAPGSVKTGEQLSAAPAAPRQTLEALKAAPVASPASAPSDELMSLPGCGFSGSDRARVVEAVRILDDPELVKLLDASGIRYRAVVDNNWMGPLFLWLVLPVGLIMLVTFFMRRMGMGGGGPQAMTFGRSRARLVAEEGTGISFADVAGIDEAKEELEEVVAFLKTPEKFLKLGGRIPKGVLLVGPPGTGKTLLARAVAGEAGVPFFLLSGSDFVEMFVGVGAARVRDLFEQALRRAPCIVFIDELDAIGKARGGAGAISSNDEREQTLNQLLVEMDGFDPKKGVIIMAATNRPEILDPALLRAGRFDRNIMVSRPDLKGREMILKVHAKKVKLNPAVDVKLVAQHTPGFSGADLANIVNEAALLAARKNREAIELVDFDEAIERVVAGLSRKGGMLNEREKKIVAYHESGHTVVAGSVAHADPVHKVSIIPRGMGALGYTLQMPSEDRYLMSRSELKDRIVVLLGGRAAEELIFKEISTGASDDLARATEIARRMVKEYGMSERMGQRTYVEGRRASMLNSDSGWPFQEREYSEHTQVAIDEEVGALVQAGYERALQILRERHDVLEVLAQRLLAEEVVDREALANLLGPPPSAGEPSSSM